jgi:glycosyltransferase involved in cell wall biosynthesis
LVTHDRGGGVQRQVDRRIEHLRRAGQHAVLLRPLPQSGAPGVLAEDPEGAPRLAFTLPSELPLLLKLLRGQQPAHLELHHTLGHNPAVLELARHLGVPYDLYVHDYACFCPRIALVSTERWHCEEPGARRCAGCVADLGQVIEEEISVAALRRRSAALFAAARRVIVPAHDVAARINRHFPDTEPQVIPWEDDALIPPLPASLPPPDTPRRVVVIGAIGIEKGYEVLLGCARDAAARSLNLSFTVVGHTIDDARLLQTGRVFITGEYADEEVVTLTKAQNCDLAFLPSVWPETWSFTLSHAWRAGLRVTAFDLGAPAERIRRTGYGWLLPPRLTPASVNNALLALH